MNIHYTNEKKCSFFPNRRKRIQIILAMKLTIFLILLTNISVTASIFGQTKVSLSMKDARLEQVLQKISTSTSYYLLYRTDEIRKVDKEITINVDNSSLESVLDYCLLNTDLKYVIEDNTVIISKKPKVIAPIIAEVEVTPPITITGKVTNKAGEPLPMVSVVVKGTKKVALADVNGKYSIQVVPEDKILVFTFLGMKKQEVQIEGRTVINVTMEEETAKIEPVVVTGMFTRKASTFTGSAVTVTAKELELSGNRNLITSLRNIDPSFNIIESNTFGSDPNRLPEIQIRGNSSLPNVNQLQDQTRVGLNTPLVILDGFESTLQKLLDLNENEVETITVLKDASATAIYGSRGANGVVVIQTKAPQPGKLRITYRGDVNIEAPDLTGYSLLNAKQKLDLEWKVGLYNNARAESDVPLKQYYNFLVNEVNKGVNTDWMALPLQLGIGQRHNLRLEGGDETFRYSASAQMNDIEGVMKGSSRKTFNGTINLTYIYKTVKFTNSLMIGMENSANSQYGVFSDYVKMNPYWRPYDSAGRVNKYVGDPGNYTYTGRWSTLPVNPLYNSTLNGFDKSKTSSIINNFAIEWAITKELLFRSKIGLTNDVVQGDKFRSADNTAFANYAIADIFRKGDYTYSIGNSFAYDGSLNLSYTKQFAQKHQLFVGIDYNLRENKNSTYGFLAEGFSNANFDFPSMALQYAIANSLSTASYAGKPGGSESLTRAVGITGSMNYTYDNRYYVDASVREDGSSQFGAKNRFAPFWSTGIGWNIHQEEFLKGSSIINRLKIRGSMGITGSQNFDSYQALSTYQYYTNDRYFNWMGAYLMGLGNDQLKWQQKMNYDLGLETSLFKQSIQFTFDYYLGRTTNLVSSINLPPSNGFTSYIENIGTMENRGFEAKLTAYLYRDYAKGISWSITGAVFRNTNKIVKISQALKDAQASIIAAGGSDPNILYREGYSTNTIWVVPSLGIDPSTGKEMYLDRNGNPTYVWNSLDLKACGTTDPKYQGNISTMFRYKSFTANLTFGYRYGGQLYNQTLIDMVENANYSYNVDSRVYDNRWQKPGDIAGFKGLQVTSLTQMTSRFVQDEKTFTCQNINLQYELKSKAFLKNMNIESLLFSASMADLFYISTVKRERGISYPFSQNVSFSVSAMF